MAFDYGPLADRARQLIENFGRKVTFMRFNQAPADPDKPWEGPVDARQNPDEEVKDMPAVFVAPGELGKEVMSEDLMKRSTQACLVAPGTELTTDLSTMNEIKDEGKQWKITGVEVLKPATQTVLYVIGVKR